VSFRDFGKAVVTYLGLDNREYCLRDRLHWPLRHPLSVKVAINFTDKRRSLGRYSSLADSGHLYFFSRNLSILGHGCHVYDFEMFLARKLAGRRSQLFGVCVRPALSFSSVCCRGNELPLIAKRGAVPARSWAFQLYMPIHLRVGESQLFTRFVESAWRRSLFLRRCLLKQKIQKTRGSGRLTQAFSTLFVCLCGQTKSAAIEADVIHLILVYANYKKVITWSLYMKASRSTNADFFRR
jgi:hypothetical protein